MTYNSHWHCKLKVVGQSDALRSAGTGNSGLQGILYCTCTLMLERLVSLQLFYEYSLLTILPGSAHPKHPLVSLQAFIFAYVYIGLYTSWLWRDCASALCWSPALLLEYNKSQPPIVNDCNGNVNLQAVRSSGVVARLYGDLHMVEAARGREGFSPGKGLICNPITPVKKVLDSWNLLQMTPESFVYMQLWPYGLQDYWILIIMCQSYPKSRIYHHIK